MQVAYEVLQPRQLAERRSEVVASLTGMLCISSDDAVRLLRKFKWYVLARQRFGACHSPLATSSLAAFLIKVA
jgi:hypothetical protein